MEMLSNINEQGSENHYKNDKCQNNLSVDYGELNKYLWTR